MSHELLHEKLKNLRKRKKLYLKDVSSGVGLSASYLSQLETGKVEPTISTLRRLAQFYGVPIVYFFETELSQDVVVRKAERKRLWSDNKTLIYEPLQGGANGKKMQATYITILPNTEYFFSSHDGEEFMIVVKGQLRFQYEGATYDLHPGDSIYYDAAKPFTFSNPLHQIIELLTVCAPPIS
ncbi:XRE family transcriptional regulator [Cloacibacillus sp. An23]|uniref:helix-turn-helix domain-containing protein n=1 Tax=Cloacibacillus sp. An23 TaxID=1965591 RepID=UPI0013026839|nr:XRE family transcriptional regulator [Cloacibacillus sp. An23]